MALPKPLRWAAKFAGGLCLLLVLLLVTLALVRIPIDLEGQKGAFQAVVSHALGREVAIQGSLKVSTSLHPVFIIEGVRIGNPAGFAEGDFLQIASARLQAALLPLLRGRIHVVDFDIRGLEMALRIDDQDRVNWLFSAPASETDQSGETSPMDAPEDPSPELASDVFALERFHLERLVVSLQAPDMDHPTQLVIVKGEGSAMAGQLLKLDLSGTLRDEPFQTEIKAASLKELIENNQTWMDIETAVAGATIRLNGRIDLASIHDSYRLGASIEGRQLERFNRLTGLDLPPVGQYGLEAQLVGQDKHVDLEKFRVFVGSSELTGKAVFNAAVNPYEIKIDLKSSLVQIDDFNFPEWSARQDSGNDSETAALQSGNPSDDDAVLEQSLELLSPDFLERFNGYLTVAAAKVQSGHDMLGRGRLVARVVDGRIAIDALELDVPGGMITIAMSLKPGPEKSRAGIKVKSENFDIGFLARRHDPETTMGGRINLDIDLESSASEPEELLSNGNGYLDFSANPENLEAGIIDLWAVNLISGIMTRADKGQSQIQCLLGRFRMTDGLLKSEAFVIDTSRMRICGKGWADFKKEAVDLKVKPTPKRPEFFNLATPLGVRGNFDDFKVGIVKGGVVGSAVNFVTSPVHVPVRRVIGPSLPEDGRDVCNLPIGPHDRPTGRLPGCRF